MTAPSVFFFCVFACNTLNVMQTKHEQQQQQTTKWLKEGKAENGVMLHRTTQGSLTLPRILVSASTSWQAHVLMR
jgi:hypothetical protein